MALTIVTTLSDQYANSYVDVAYADNFWASHYNAAKAAQWAALTTNQKTAALIEACRVLETARFTIKTDRFTNGEYNWYYDYASGLVINVERHESPAKVYFFQALQFPRNFDRDLDSGDYFIPEAVKMAQCEQAVYLLNFDDSSMVSSLQGVQSESVTVGPVSTETVYREGTVGNKWSPTALSYMKPFMMKRSQQIRRG